MEAFSVKIISKNPKNILTSTQRRHSSSKSKIFEEYLKKLFNQAKTRNKQIYIASSLNLNPIVYKVNANLTTYMETIFFNYLAIISKPTRISKRNATAIDHINTTNFLKTDMKTGVLKADTSNYFTLFLISAATWVNKKTN